MISRGASGAHVCWRCQLRLSKSLPTTQISFARFLRSKGVRPLHDGTEASRTIARTLDVLQSDHEEGMPRKARKAKHGSSAWHPLGRLHGFRGHRVREKRAELDIESLGKPAEVIVLRDAGFHSKPLPEIEELKVVEKVDILKQLDAERGLITQADVENNIEECRPKTKTIGWAEFQRIQQQLVSGFTTSQLIKYFDAPRHRQMKVGEGNDVSSGESSRGALTGRTQWMPQVSETGDGFEEGSLRGYDSEAFTPKQRLALLLMRRCWQLEAREITESLGEVELEIASTDFELLIEGRTPPLKVISDEFITSQEEKIEAFRSRSVVRITATKEKSEAIAQAIQATLQGIRSLTIDLNPLSSRCESPKSGAKSPIGGAFDEALISKLAQLTETHITRQPNNRILVSCINSKPETQLSTKADIARRLLLTSSDLANRTKTLTTYDERLESLVAVKYHMTNGMSWRNRLRNWVRWTSATSKSAQSHGGPNATSLPQETKTKLENPSQTNSVGLLVSAVQSQDQTNEAKIQKDTEVPGDVYWNHETFAETSAIVGHILHEVPTTAELSTELAKDTAVKRTMFHPAPTSISRLIGSMPLLSNLPTSSLLLRFFPSPWTSAGVEVLVSSPPVEMRFAVDTNTKELHLTEVAAVVESTASDVMLPNRSLDLRFQQKTTARLRTMTLHELPEISKFLKASQLNLMRGRLETPPGLTLPIANHLCNDSVSEALKTCVNKSINTEYIFGGLEYRSTLALDFHGWQLLYTSIEGGKADGRRAELSLTPRRVVDEVSHGKESSDFLTEEFIEAAYRLVDTLANFETAPEEVVSSSITTHDKEPPGLSYSTRQEKNKDFRYFRGNINFSTNHVMENEGSDPEKH